MLFNKILLGLGLVLGVIGGMSSPASAALPPNSFQPIQCLTAGEKQVTVAGPSYQAPFAWDPAGFYHFTNCRPAISYIPGSASNVQYLTLAVNSAFTPVGLLDYLDWKPASKRATSKVCKSNPGRDFVITHNIIQVDPRPTLYETSLYLCKELAPIKLKRGMAPIIGQRIQTNLLRSTLWIAGNQISQPISWSQQLSGPRPLRVVDLNGVVLP